MSHRTLSFAVLLALALPAGASAADYVWIEAESLANPPAGFKSGGWGNKQYLSGDDWLFAAIDGKDAEALPPDGLSLRYPFDTKTAGTYEVWGRVGYEFVRSPFKWRVDDGAWGTEEPEHLTTDLMEIAEWTEIAWVKLGTVDLAAGKHTLHFQFERRVLPGKDKPERILAGLDCFCLSKGPFRPNGRHKPDEQWQTAEDKGAAERVVELKDAGTPRSVLPLDGAWQIARWDEQQIEDRAEPVLALPPGYQDLFWKSVRVPGNRDSVRPDLLFCHRFLYRLRVRVPADVKDRSFVLRFPSTALLASVFVNGQFVGGSDTPCAAWEADATKAVKPGEVNEIVVAIKDCYYALAKTGDGKSCRYMFNFPTNWFYSNGGLGACSFADFPVLLQVHGAGIFETPTLTVAGPAYVADVFAKPSVKKRQLGLEITVHNPSGAPLDVAVANEIVPLGGGAAAKTFAVKTVTVDAGADKLLDLAEEWTDAKLWWPDDPLQYVAVTRLSVGGRVVDEKRTKFGFREWEWAGQSFKLNAVPWHFHADLLHNGKITDPERAVADWKKSGVNTVRYWGMEPWFGTSQEETLDFYDRVGMPIRRTGIFDGEAASYQVVENKDGKTVARKALFDHWRKQMAAWVKAERNHPSIFIWSVENEITYINIRNFGLMPFCEPEIRRGIEEVMKLDPTRPAMTDGGDALLDKSLPIYGNHYNESDFRHYPDEAYDMKLAFARKAPWQIGDDRPLFLGETFFANGYPPAAYSAVMGDAAFLGRNQAEPGVRLYARMLAEGYRWHGVAGFHFWFSGESPDAEHYQAFQPVCVLVREWNSTFASGKSVTRTLKVFNDTHYDDPIELSWEFDSGGKGIAGKPLILQVAPGTAKETTVTFMAPQVRVRTAAELVLICRVKGKEVFRDVKKCTVLGPEAPKPTLNIELLVLDPKGVVKDRLKERGIAFQSVESFDAIPDKVGVLIVGPDCLTARQATDPKWRNLAASGARILVLDQEHPLHYQAVPADLEPTPHSGRIAFPEDLEHPVFEGLGASDFFCWSGDHAVYRHAYKKASRGARSLLQCDDELSCSALVECPVGPGLLLLAQVDFGAKLKTDPVAQRLFDNLLLRAANYKLLARPVVAVFPDGDLRLKMLDAIGLKYDRGVDVVAAVADPKSEIIVADASPANLQRLEAANERVQAFLNRGGHLMLWGLTPQGLSDFNKVVGVPHVIRPFAMERVTLPGKRDPLLAGLTMRDVALEGTEQIYPWAADRYPAADTFTHVVDLDDIAPFCKPDPRYVDGWSKMTNGLTSADSWKFIFYHDLSKSDPKPKWSADLPKEEEVTGFSIIINAHYKRISKLRLRFDDDPSRDMVFDLKPVAELRQDFTFPARRCKRITLEPLAWDNAKENPVIGVDNIWITVRRGEDYARKVAPLLNIGGLVRYRMGQGGVVLNQVRVLANEASPINSDKKRTLVATLLRNLGASFAGEKTLVVSANLKYDPIPLGEKCTQYLTSERGWLNDAPDLGHLPVGEQRFGGVPFVIRDFKTSPLPSCIMLAGPGVKGPMPQAVEGIPVNRKADALLFLHTFNRVKEWKGTKERPEPPVVFVYVITYADGKTEQVPVHYEREVGHWISAQPEGRVGASVAWAAPFPKDAGRQAVVYRMTWTNPRPEVEIKSLAVRYDSNGGAEYGVPVVLGVTAASAP